MNKKQVKELLKSVIKQLPEVDRQSQIVLRDAASELGIENNREQQKMLLEAFNDLYREGFYGWGIDIDNSGSPFIHLSTK